MYDNKHKCEYVLIVLSLSLFRHQGHYVLSRCWFSVCLCLRTELPGKSGDRQKLKWTGNDMSPDGDQEVFQGTC